MEREVVLQVQLAGYCFWTLTQGVAPFIRLQVKGLTRRANCISKPSTELHFHQSSARSQVVLT
jgi:hypothetical protein